MNDTTTPATLTIDRYRLRRFNRRAERRAELAKLVWPVDSDRRTKRQESASLMARDLEAEIRLSLAFAVDGRSIEDAAGFDETDYFVSYADDQWTDHKTMADKHNADLRSENRIWSSQSGTDWWGAISPSGFGSYGPSDHAPTEDGSKLDFDVSEAAAAESFTDIPEAKLLEARKAAGLNETGGWYRIGDSDEPMPSYLIEDEIDEFGSVEAAGAYDFDYSIEDAVREGATYRSDR